MSKESVNTTEHVRELLEPKRPADALEKQLDKLEFSELLHAVFQLTHDEQRQLLASVSPEWRPNWLRNCRTPTPPI